jgi:hypothetical protein
MRLATPNTKQSSYDLERTLTKRHEHATIAGAPNSGSTSTSAEVNAADTVGPKAAPNPGVDPDGR